MDRRERRESERGVILVFTAIAILVLMGFLTFVADYGILWASRAQAQNAADAGALAGAIARAFDDTDDPPATGGKAEESARKTAQQNNVWNAAPVAQVSWTCPAGVTGSCVRVDVYRNGQFGSTTLPVVFGPVLNITSQGVRATATAVVGVGNATNCMRPFGVVDRWHENLAPTGDFARWDNSGNQFTGPIDWYEPPTSGSTGSGYSVPTDVGSPVVLKTGNNPDSNTGAITPGWSLPLRLPSGGGGYYSGANDYNLAIKQCIGNPVSIGDYLPTENGAMVGPTRQGVSTDGAGAAGGPSLVNQDPYATWDTSTQTVRNSCAPACGPFSPRIVPIAVFDFDEFIWRHNANNWTTEWIPGASGSPGHPGGGTFSCPVGGKCVRVANIIGFFVESMSGGDVTGRVVMLPGEYVLGTPSLGSGSSFLQTIHLVR